MTWGEVFQYSGMRKKQKKAKNLKEFLDMEDRIKGTFYKKNEDKDRRV